VTLSGPIEVTWSHGEPYRCPNGAGFTCYYCNTSKKCGGVSRLREHLGGLPGNVKECKNVPRHIKALMADEVTEGRIRRKRSTNLRLYVEKEVAAQRVSGRTTIPLDEEGQIRMAMRESLRDSTSTKQHDSSFDAPFNVDLARSKTQAQPRVDVMLEGVAKE